MMLHLTVALAEVVLYTLHSAFSYYDEGGYKGSLMVASSPKRRPKTIPKKTKKKKREIWVLFRWFLSSIPYSY